MRTFVKSKNSLFFSVFFYFLFFFEDGIRMHHINLIQKRQVLQRMIPPIKPTIGTITAQLINLPSVTSIGRPPTKTFLANISGESSIMKYASGLDGTPGLRVTSRFSDVSVAGPKLTTKIIFQTSLRISLKI